MSIVGDVLNRVKQYRIKKDLRHYKAEVINHYLKRASTKEINLSLLNIREALRKVFLRLPEDILYNLMRSRDPIIITGVPPYASCTSFYKKRNGLDFKQGFRLLQIREEVDNYSVDIIMGVVAHEIAHIFLHCELDKDKKEADEEANKLVMEWGFTKELLNASHSLKRWVDGE